MPIQLNGKNIGFECSDAGGWCVSIGDVDHVLAGSLGLSERRCSGDRAVRLDGRVWSS